MRQDSDELNALWLPAIACVWILINICIGPWIVSRWLIRLLFIGVINPLFDNIIVNTNQSRSEKQEVQNESK